MAKKTLAELVAAVHDITPPSDDTVAYLNEAQRDIVTESERAKTVDVLVVAGKVPVPEDALYVRAVAFQGKILQLFPSHVLASSSSVQGSYPRYYLPQGDNIEVYPAVENGRAITIVYCPAPTELEDDDDMSELDGADDAMIAFAKSKIYKRHEDVMQAAFWQNNYAEEAAKWVVNENRKYRRRREMRVRPFM